METEHLSALLEMNIDRIYCDYSKANLDNIERLDKENDLSDIELFIKLPQIVREEELERLKVGIKRLEESNIAGYLVTNLGIAELLKDTDKKLIADYTVHNFNSYTIGHWQNQDYDGVVLSPELTLQEIKRITDCNQIKKEIKVYGHLPMMISEYCPIGGVATGFDSSKDCHQACLNKNYGLKDRKGFIAPIKTDPVTCRSTIYNSQPLFLVDYLDEIVRAGCQRFRLDFINESKAEMIEIIQAYREKLDNLEVNHPRLKVKMQRKGYTTGHFYRGVK